MKRLNQKQTAKGQSRRDFLKINAVAGAGLLVPWVAKGNHEALFKSQPRLDVRTVPKYGTDLPIPAVMPKTATSQTLDYYEIGIRQFQQQILPAGYPKTLVAGYGPAGDPDNARFGTPARTIVADAEKPVRVKWVNQQVDANNNFLPHVLADEMFPDHVMWANPPGPRDSHGNRFVHTPYRGPVPIVTHLHGGHSKQQSDGHPLAWYLPAAGNIPAGFFTEGSLYNGFGALSSTPWGPGFATFDYTNDVATLLWCHDHTLGITEFNVYAGFAGGFLVQGGDFDLQPGILPNPAYQVPLIIQDRSFKPDGSLLFRSQEVGGTGEAIMVNGSTWPKLQVEQRRYRFRILNGCNNVNLDLRLSNGLPLWVIGGDIGFLPRAAQVEHLPLTNAERADVIVDFANVPVGTELLLLNSGSDARAATTGQVMKFIVRSRTSADTSTPPSQLGTLPVNRIPATEVKTRRLAILDTRQGIIDANGNPISLEFEDAVTETPKAGTVEIWELYGFDSHPMHLHAADFQILSRQPFGGSVRGPKRWETGVKDTVDIDESGVTRLRVRFDKEPGLFVWHCHLLEHEDLGMMRPLELQP